MHSNQYKIVIFSAHVKIAHLMHDFKQKQYASVCAKSLKYIWNATFRREHILIKN